MTHYSFDPHPNLRDLIEGFHQRNPYFPTLGAGAVSSAETTAGDSDVDTQHLVFRPASVPSLPVLRRRTPTETAWARAASRIGMSFAEYRRRRLAGERWCPAPNHQDWVPATAFGRSRNFPYCLACQRRMRAERRSAS